MYFLLDKFYVCWIRKNKTINLCLTIDAYVTFLKYGNANSVNTANLLAVPYFRNLT